MKHAHLHYLPASHAEHVANFVAAFLTTVTIMDLPHETRQFLGAMVGILWMVATAFSWRAANQMRRIRVSKN